jgi:Kdo2-lipid IVA lauroyltransferase/acyltransferase
MRHLPWPLRPIFALLWLAGALSLRGSHRVGRWLGRLVGRMDRRDTRIAHGNIARCFPELDASAQAALVAATLAETARTLLETLRLWTRPFGSQLAWIVDVVGREHLDRARQGGRGVIVAAPHLGNWELLNQYLATLGPLAIVYRAPEQRFLEPLLLQGRGGTRIAQLRADPSSVRGMLKHLRGGGMLGLLPDQRPKSGEGEWAPFFGQPARTMTLLPRLAQSAGVDVVFGFAERLTGGRGFRLHFLPAPGGLLDPDPLRATAALNAGVEACTRIAPAQYQWTYRRFPRALPPLAGHGGGPSTSGTP